MKALAILFSVAAVGFDASRAIADDTLQPHRQLHTRIPLDIDEMPLETVLNVIGVVAELDIEVTEAIGKDLRRAPVSIHVKDISAESALTLVLAPVGLTYRLRGARIFVVEDDGTADHETREHALHDLTVAWRDAAHVKMILDTIITPPQHDPCSCGPLVVARVPPEYSMEMTCDGVLLWAHPELHEEFSDFMRLLARAEPEEPDEKD